MEKKKVFIMYFGIEKTVELIMLNAAKDLGIKLDVTCAQEQSNKQLPRNYDIYLVHPGDLRSR